MLFISHAGQDAQPARELARRLREAGLSTWIDVDDLKPGEPWQATIERLVAREASALVVYVGAGGVQRWVELEMRTAISRWMSDAERSFRIVAVLGPGASYGELPAFLQHFQWVDATAGLDEAVEKLRAALDARAPERVANLPEDRPPFMGLRPFEENDAELYFGRDAEVTELLRLMARDRLVAVVGDSGSGKSSLVRAGLLPALRRGRFGAARGEDRPWSVAILRPGTNPLDGVVRGLPQLAPEREQAERTRLEDAWREVLPKGPERLVDCALGLLPPHGRALLVVDQFEEVFAKEVTAERRAWFLDALLAAADQRGDQDLYVVLTLRYDFLPHCFEHATWWERMTASRLDLGRLPRERMREAIQKPVALAGLSIPESLVDALLTAAGDEPGNLALLEFALFQLWQARAGRELSHECYLAMGGLEGALGRHADGVYEALPSDPQRALARRALVKLTHVEGARDTRRRLAREALFAELGGERGAAEAMLERLVNERLLTAGQDSIEIAHEALIRHWPKLVAWLDESRERERVERRLATQLEAWLAHDRDATFLLSGGQLAEVKAWFARERAELGPGLAEFLDTSLAERERLDRGEHKRSSEFAASSAEIPSPMGLRPLQGEQVEPAFGRDSAEEPKTKRRAFVVRDFTVAQVQDWLESVRRNGAGVWSVRVAGPDTDLSRGQVFFDVVRPEIEAADKVVALLERPNANVAFEIGYALGRSKPVVLATSDPAEVAHLKACAPFQGLGVPPVTSVGELRRLISEAEGLLDVPPPKEGDETLFLCSAREGEQYCIELLKAGIRWRKYDSDQWQLRRLPELLRGVRRVVWTITPVAGSHPTLRDGPGNTACAALAGFACAHDLDLHVLRAKSARTVVDVEAIEHEFDGLEAFLALAREVADGKVESPVLPLSTVPARAASQLETLYLRREELVAAGGDTTELDETIVGVKRRLREGPSLAKGDVFGERYVLERRLGEGGFGQVWKAWDRKAERFVALKFLHGAHVHERSRVQRFIRGAKQQARLNHPHILRVHEPAGEEGAWRYLVMDFIEGADLHRAVASKSLERTEILRVLSEVADALDHAWEKEKLIHRDVKPANILLDRKRKSYLTDFDLVHAPASTQGTMPGQPLGTYAFAAPEVLDGNAKPIRQSDLWSLAMTALWALSGGQAVGRGEQEIERGLARTGLPSRGKRALRTCLHAEPTRRLGSARELVEALSLPEPAPGRGRRRAALLGLLSIVLIAALLHWTRRPDAGGDAPPLVLPRSDGVVAVPVAPPRFDRVVGVPVEGLVDLGLDEHEMPTFAPTKDETVILVQVPAGSFWMGASTDGGSRHYDAGAYLVEGPPHEIQMPAFLIAKTEITNAQYGRFLEERPDVDDPEYWEGSEKERAQLPVVGVSWDEAREYCRWLGLDLPTEAQWEYACRAGSSTPWHTGEALSVEDASIGFRNGPRDVASYMANAWGLYDMHGNVWEWCLDGWANYEQAKAWHPLAFPTEGAAGRVARGGSFDGPARLARSASRAPGDPGLRRAFLGFRPAQGIEP